jgi:hypothetical protein
LAIFANCADMRGHLDERKLADSLAPARGTSRAKSATR